jgi:hypothetical protein
MCRPLQDSRSVRLITANMALATPKNGKASQKGDKSYRGKFKANVEKLLESRELRQACVLCRISVYWEGEDQFFRVRSHFFLSLQ